MPLTITRPEEFKIKFTALEKLCPKEVDNADKAWVSLSTTLLAISISLFFFNLSVHYVLMGE